LLIGEAVAPRTHHQQLWRGTDDQNNSKYHYYDASAKQWIDFELPPADCASCDITWLVNQFQKNTLRYATPVEDIIILVDGKDLDGASDSRMLAGAFLIVEVVPGGKILKPLKGAAKVATRGTRKIAITIGKTGRRFIGEVVDGVYKPYKWIKSTAKIDEVLDVTDEVTYLAEDGVKRVGKLEVVRSGSEYGVRAIVEIVRKIIYPSVKINGATVVRILEGTNGKIAIMGRKMAYIEEVANGLIKLGKEVEIFDIDKAFGGKGYSNWDLIKKDWDNALDRFGQLDSNGNKVLPYQKVIQTLWYKENERWARWVKENGYEIYDLGDNPGLLKNSPDRSAFYDLEKKIIFDELN